MGVMCQRSLAVETTKVIYVCESSQGQRNPPSRRRLKGVQCQLKKQDGYETS